MFKSYNSTLQISSRVIINYISGKTICGIKNNFIL